MKFIFVVCFLIFSRNFLVADNLDSLNENEYKIESSYVSLSGFFENFKKTDAYIDNGERVPNYKSYSYFNSSLNTVINNYKLELRYSRMIENNIDLYDVGALGGYNIEFFDLLDISAVLGLAYTRKLGTKVVTIGIPYELQFIVHNKGAGIGINVFGNINSIYNMIGFGITLQIGKFREDDPD